MLEEHWKNSSLKQPYPYFDDFSLPEPAIWILNPYSLAREAHGKNELSDISMKKQQDYYESFFINNNWKFNLALPSYSPWSNVRLASQQGMFTIHGLDNQPIDEQSGNVRYLDKVAIPKAAAIYAVRHLKTVMSLDKFIMFRDEDNLGKRVKSRFIAPVSYTHLTLPTILLV